MPIAKFITDATTCPISRRITEFAPLRDEAMVPTARVAVIGVEGGLGHLTPGFCRAWGWVR